jgi:hypothetical protein
MKEPNSQAEKPETERRYDPELLKKGLRCDLDQYEMLKRCSDKKDMTEWNRWRNDNREKEILLEGTKLSYAHLAGADLFYANFRSAWLLKANLESVLLGGANLKGATFFQANLKGACLVEANIENAKLQSSNLEGADLGLAILKGTNFRFAVVDSYTLLMPKVFDRFTDFTGVGLGSCRIDPATKQLLEYNIRRMNWEDWYKEHSFLKWLVKPFWLISRAIALKIQHFE